MAVITLAPGGDSTTMDDHGFLVGFESAAIPKKEWHHREHIRMAFLYLRDLPFEEGLERIRSGIRALNRANGVADTESSGYHETVTVAWAHIIAAAIEAHGPSESFDAFARENSHLLSKSLLRLYYTKERVLTSLARSSFVEPDLAPFPRRLGRPDHPLQPSGSAGC